jgi:hypothetical protein
MEHKPWLHLDIKNRSFFSKLKCKYNDSKIDNIISYVIIQDCNQAGHYYRILMWNKDKKLVHYKIEDDSTWYFDKSLENMKDNDIVIELDSNLQYKVLDIYKSIFVKVLELIE